MLWSFSSNASGYYAPSHQTRWGWYSVQNEDSIPHGCSSKPTWATIAPSGVTPIMYSFRVTDEFIEVFHSDVGSRCFSWKAVI